jgi:hypothetical protein
MAGNAMPEMLKALNSKPTVTDNVTVYFGPTRNEAQFSAIRRLIQHARSGVLFLMANPGMSPLLSALLDLAKSNIIHVRGAISNLAPRNELWTVGGQVIESGATPLAFHDDILTPSGLTDGNISHWVLREFYWSEV